MMNREQLFKAMGEIKEDWIDDAAPRSRGVPFRRPLRWPAAVAAVFIGLIAFAALRFSPLVGTPGTVPSIANKSGESAVIQPTDTEPTLPLLTVTTYAGDMGFEGMMAYKFSELSTGNPWKPEMNLTKLPVFYNKRTVGKDGMPIQGTTTDEMLATAKVMAARLKMENPKVQIISATGWIWKDLDGEIPKSFTLGNLAFRGKRYDIEIDRTLRITIKFNTPIVLPEGYSFYDYLAFDPVKKTATYFKENFPSFLQMKDPQISIRGGDYDYEATFQQHELYFYDASEDPVQALLNYNFRSVRVLGTEEGRTITDILIDNEDLSNKVGDYPIISVDQARKLLDTGFYFTTVPAEFPGLDSIAGVELMYRKSIYDTYYMPYYRFFIEMPAGTVPTGGMAPRLKTFGVYYVPAVDQRYIGNMPVYTPSFN